MPNDKALRALEKAVAATIPSEPYRRGRPGAAVSKLSPEDREALKGLTSEDVEKMRIYFPPGEDLVGEDPSIAAKKRRIERHARKRS